MQANRNQSIETTTTTAALHSGKPNINLINYVALHNSMIIMQTNTTHNHISYFIYFMYMNLLFGLFFLHIFTKMLPRYGYYHFISVLNILFIIINNSYNHNLLK